MLDFIFFFDFILSRIHVDYGLNTLRSEAKNATYIPIISFTKVKFFSGVADTIIPTTNPITIGINLMKKVEKDT